MGTVASREPRLCSMPGSLAIEGCADVFVEEDRQSAPKMGWDRPTVFAMDDAGVAPDVIPQTEKQKPGLSLDLAGLREPLLHRQAQSSSSTCSTPLASFSTPSSSHTSTPAITPPSQQPSSCKPSTMASLDLSEIQLHSPNAQIVGTPFATSSTPFEYPFPTDSSTSSTSSSPSSSNISMSHFTSPASSSLSVGPPSPGHILPSATTLINGSITHHPPQAMPVGGDFPLPPGQSMITLTHPKMRSTTPPIPPSLLKKQQDKLAYMQSRARRSTVDLSTSSESALQTRWRSGSQSVQS